MLDKNTQAPQELEVTGQVVNPLGQIQSLEFQKITEAEAVYYITQFDYTNAETLRFTINIGDEQTLKFNQEFLVERLTFDLVTHRFNTNGLDIAGFANVSYR